MTRILPCPRVLRTPGSPPGRAPVGPWPDYLQLGGQRYQGGLVRRPAGEHDTDRQAVRGPVQRHVDGRLPGHVVRRGERREPGLGGEVGSRVGVVAERTDERRGLGQRGREDGVVGAGGGDRDPGGALQLPVSYTHLRAHETRHDLVCRLLLEKKKKITETKNKTKKKTSRTTTRHKQTTLH